MNIAILLTVVLAAIALIHVLWALGIWWPIRDEAALVRAVAGAKGATRMPPKGVTWVVVAALLALIWWIWFGAMFGPRIHVLGLWVAMAVSFLRGVAAWLPSWREKWPQEPFATLDKKYYGPLCIAIGLAIRIVMKGVS